MTIEKQEKIVLCPKLIQIILKSIQDSYPYMYMNSNKYAYSYIYNFISMSWTRLLDSSAYLQFMHFISIANLDWSFQEAKNFFPLWRK
jgi:hypothetical protein